MDIIFVIHAVLLVLMLYYALCFVKIVHYSKQRFFFGSISSLFPSSQKNLQARKWARRFWTTLVMLISLVPILVFLHAKNS